MTLNRISWNINGSNYPDKNYFNDFLRKQKPSTVLVMLDRQLAIDLAAALPNTKVVHRAYSEHDHVFWSTDKQSDGQVRYVSPQQFVAEEISWGHPEVYRYVLNEPAVGDSRMIAWLVDVGKRFVDAGYKAVLGNISVGGYEAHHVESGYFDPLLKMSVDFENIYFGCHEYTGILLPFGVGQWGFDQLYTKERCQPKDWPKPEALPIKRYWNEETQHWDLPPYWNFRRSDWWTIRSQEQGYGTPKYWITEAGWDALPNLGARGVYEHFQRIYGIPAPHKSIRGVNTLKPIFEDYFRELGWSFQRAAFEQLKWLDSIYPANYVGLNLFTVSGSPDWKDDAGCDFSPLRELHSLLLAETITQPPAPPPIVDVPFPTTGFVPAALAPVNFPFNVRAQPNTTSAIVATIAVKEHGKIAVNSAYPDGSFLWYALRINGIQGWCRNDVFDATLDETQPPAPVRTTRTFEANFLASDDEHERLRDALRAVINVHMGAIE